MLVKIGDVIGKFGVSHRSLHYWEDIGIIKSARAENDYRYYDEDTQRKIGQILILRKLRLPLRQIIMVLDSENTTEIIETFQRNLSEVGDEITALSTIKSILSTFVDRLNQDIMIDLKLNLLDDSSILEIADSLTVNKPALKKEKVADDLAKASEHLMKVTDEDIRIVYLPPSTVASALGVGDEAERDADAMMSAFVKDADLFRMHPGARFYGFNNPQFGLNGEFIQHQYEVWATVPDDLSITAPLIKKRFEGGLYAVFTSKPVSFDEWKPFGIWLSNSEDFEYDGGRSYREDTSADHKVICSGWGCIEDHFNSYNVYGLKSKKHVLSHMDFLMPVREKNQN